jgi:hypothetical protein
MDIVGLIKKSYSNHGQIVPDSWYNLLRENYQANVSEKIYMKFIIIFRKERKNIHEKFSVEGHDQKNLYN